MFGRLQKRLRNIFIAGLLITLPIALTIFILKFLFKNLDALSPTFTNLLIEMGAPIPEGYRIPFLGVAVTLTIIFLVGAFATNIFGNKLVQIGEKIVEKIPFVRRIYSGTKQIVTSFASVDGQSFNKVVLIEFPRKGAYALGFVTGKTRGEIQKKTDFQAYNVFVPTTPNPTSGFLIFSPPGELTELSMSIEEGVKYVISGGIVDPISAKSLAKEQSKD
ncbi:MAG: DUF502 domain-containing protein [Candidatus Nitrohelix vancouverensis]|uniref:DUF502 domain-containing protein n=1 Tax=Candidatus Nitrohelix vancouverensis TaxID=2705534 RepID=A0A7T0G3L2_9BACT|nr:MAG: DUF502 domain-containing protein [Candidatus Nitrohelix vancouverensis]